MFILVFFISALVLSPFFYHKRVLDYTWWGKSIEKLVAGKAIGPEDSTFGYPGATILMPAQLPAMNGLDAVYSLEIIMVIELSILIACLACLAYIMRPKSMWWAAVAGMLIVNPLYYGATPPSALLGPLAIFIVLLTLYIYEHRAENTTKALVALGIVGGVSMATRLDISILLLFASAVFLWFAVQKKIFIAIAIGIVSFYILTPFVWFHPIQYFLQIEEKIGVHLDKVTPTTFMDLMNMGHLAMVGYLLGIFLLIKNRLVNVPRAFLGWILVLTIIVAGILFSMSHHPPWFFLPLIFMWEALLPLFILSFIEQNNTYFTETRFGGKKRLMIDIIIALIVLRSVLLFI